MSFNAGYIGVMGLGSHNHNFSPKIVHSIYDLGSAHVLRYAGSAEFNLLTTQDEAVWEFPQLLNISPSRHEIKAVEGFSGEQLVALANQDLWRDPVNAFNRRALAAFYQANIVLGRVLYGLSLKGGTSVVSTYGVTDFKQMAPRFPITAMSVLPDRADQREKLASDYRLFHQLQTENIIDTTLMADTRSKLAIKFGLHKQDEWVAQAYASLIAGQDHFPNQPSFGDVMTALAHYSAWVGTAHASRSLVGGTSVPWWSLIGKVWELPERGNGKLDNIEQAAVACIEEVLANPDAQAIEDTINPHAQAFVTLVVPLKRRDGRWKPLAARIRHKLLQDWPNVKPLFCSGSGIADPRYPSASYWCSAHLFHPLSPEPVVIQRIRQETVLKPQQIWNVERREPRQLRRGVTR